MSHIEYRYTRSGLGPVTVEDKPQPFRLSIVYYAPKPAWMEHIVGPRLRFKNRLDFESYLRRTA